MGRNEIKKLKATIFKKVDQLNDETFLQMAEEVITSYSSASQKEIPDELTPDQQQRLHESINRQIKPRRPRGAGVLPDLFNNKLSLH